MAFYKTASIPIVSVYQSSGRFTKRASQNDDMDKQEEQLVERAISVISKEVLSAIAKIYNLSDNINDYIFPIPRAVTADIPNNNGDCFDHPELTRFSPQHRCMVFETFRNDPLHVEHAASDPKTARGYLPDVVYLTQDPKDKHVLTIAAVDTTKDVPFAEGVLNGDIDKFSMGCICSHVKCSYSKCKNPVAYTDKELCDHLKWYKMATLDRELIFEHCYGVEYQELSAVGNPADPKAVTQALLKYASKQAEYGNIKASFNVISSLVSGPDAVEVARYFNANAGRLPDSMLRLADKLF